MNDRPVRRRRRTRGALVASAVLVALVLVGTDALVRVKPVVDTDDLVVQGVPPLTPSAAEPRTCLRGVEATGIVEVREELAPGERVSSAQIDACPQAFDGLMVTFAGEAIGDLLRRRGGAWLQVNDDPYALELGPLSRHEQHRGPNSGLSVWLPDGLHEQVGGLGRPDRRGDVLLIDGILTRTDPSDGGSTTLRAQRLTVLAPSVELAEPFHPLQAAVALVMGVLALAALVWSRRARAG